MKVLIVTQPNPTGLTYHRQTVPHNHLTRNYPDCEIDYTYDVSEATKEELQNYQIVSFLRIVDHNDNTEAIINKCKEAGCKVIIDIDDYWVLHKDHELKAAYEAHKIHEKTITGLRLADWVTTTTEHFADKIKGITQNATVLANSIDPAEDQFKPEPKESERVRLGWIGGVYHSQDIALMQSGISEVWKGCNHKSFQFCLGGFNPNPAYQYIEGVFTCGFKFPKDKEYRKYLSTMMKLHNERGDSQPYKRLWGLDVFNYARLYNEIDVALVPLAENSFNSFKSQIKIIEAGWFKKPVIVSNVQPYTYDCNRTNSILISPSKRGDGWGVAMKSLILNPDKGEDIAAALHELVKEKYTMDTVNKTRYDLYKRLCE